MRITEYDDYDYEQATLAFNSLVLEMANLRASHKQEVNELSLYILASYERMLDTQPDS